MRIQSRMPERCIEIVDLIGRERVLTALRRGMDVAQWKPGLVCEISLEQSMSADYLTSDPLSVRRQLELLAARFHQALLLHASEQLHESPIFDPQDSAERRKRAMTPAILQIEQMFQRILYLCAPTDDATPTDMADENDESGRENHRRQHD